MAIAGTLNGYRPEYISRKQIRSYIEKLVENGMLSYTGEGKMRTYSLSKRYESEMALITKAVEIGLNEMKKQAKGQKIFTQTDIIVIAKFCSSTITICIV